MKRMLNLLLLIICLAICSNCSSQEKIYLKPDLKLKINLIIDSYQKFVSDKNSNSFDPPIYEITFRELEGECYLEINTNHFYRTELNGFMFIKNKLVTFNNVNSRCNQNLIKINKSESAQNLTDYQTENAAFDNYSPAYWTFKIKDGNLIQDAQGKLKIDFTKK